MSEKLVMTFFLLTVGTLMLSQQFVNKSYTDLRKKYENLKKEDETALPSVHAFILKARRDKNAEKLYLGYKDAVFYVKDPHAKLAYADSTISVALASKNNELISDAYLGKGIIYYFNFRKFQKASDWYLKAHQYSLKTDDEYLKKKIIYHLGVVNSYLGYYRKALQLFNQSIQFYEQQSKNTVDKNLNYNYSRGYLNSLHQMVICHRNLNEDSKADSLLMVGLSITKNRSEYILENAYFLKCNGIMYYKNKKYNDALYYLKKALPIINEKKDFTWAAVIHSYLGNIYMKTGEEKRGVAELKKVDSIYQQHQFILPEATGSYIDLIDYYKKNGNEQEQLRYTNQLLKANEGIRTDFTYLAAKIYEDFEIAGLIKDKNNLEQSISKQQIFAGLILVLFAIVINRMIYRYRQREKDLKRRYDELIIRLKPVKLDEGLNVERPQRSSKNRVDLPDNVVEKLRKKIESFEAKNQYLEPGITAAKLAESFKTNATYLSAYIREFKGVNFSTYITHLRINYITHKLNSDKDYPKYTIKALTESCGIASRNNFTDHFKRINGISVADFIKIKLKDNEKEQ